jgi:hypothetical protein
MAKKKAAQAAAEGQVKARVLAACVIDGAALNADDVAVASKEEIERNAALGNVDPHEDAVAYAESLAE